MRDDEANYVRENFINKLLGSKLIIMPKVIVDSKGITLFLNEATTQVSCSIMTPIRAT